MDFDRHIHDSADKPKNSMLGMPLDRGMNTAARLNNLAEISLSLSLIS